jgi:transient receptor potential cation channel subfamily M protein 2
MYSKNGWGLEMPKLILSVTGGAQNFRVHSRLKKAFKNGLMRAAISTNAWVITGGTNAGVMKLVGEAVAEESHKHSLTLIGVATWGKVLNRNLLKNESDAIPEVTSLDQNHTHFLLVDDGSEEQYGKEITFRAMLEQEIILGKCLEHYKGNEHVADGNFIPMVLIVVNGGPKTLETVIKSVKGNTPVLLLEGSGGCADLIADAIGQK